MEYFFRKKNGTIKVSLPTDIRKEGSAYDLTLAIGILAASEQIAGASELEDYYIMGGAVVGRFAAARTSKSGT